MEGRDKKQYKIYTRDEAMLIVELFEEILSRYDISVPSPEDDERDKENAIGLYGSTYSDLIDTVEEKLQAMLWLKQNGAEVITGKFSGNV